MNAFVDSALEINNETTTENGARAYVSTLDANVDLFYKIGTSRGVDITKEFVAAYVEDKELALRVAAWARDVRGGSGERETFRNVLRYLEKNDRKGAVALLAITPEIGRWDDVLVFNYDSELKAKAFDMVKEALASGNKLCAKWMPRKGSVAVELRKHLGMTPKQYRKTLVTLSETVEQKMCAKKFTEINFSHVPSLAASRYKKAFNRNAPVEYGAYVAELEKPVELRDPNVKVNASAIFPHDVLKGCLYFNETEKKLVVAQWDALPNYVKSGSILPMVDVSGSMNRPIPNSTFNVMEVAISLGLYLSDKCKGDFKDTFLTFSETPKIVRLQGNIIQKIQQMNSSNWGMNTNITKAFEHILDVAVRGKVPQEEMPEYLLILSDMQFDRCGKMTNFEIAKNAFKEAGYDLPKIVFWNLNSHDNVPVTANEHGVALVSGFSPAIAQTILSGDLEEFTPRALMLKAVMNPRYAVEI